MTSWNVVTTNRYQDVDDASDYWVDCEGSDKGGTATKVVLALVAINEIMMQK